MTIVDQHIAHCGREPKIYVLGEGTVQNEDTKLLVIVPLFMTDDGMRMTIKESTGTRQTVEVPWCISFMMLIPNEVEIKILGPDSGHVGFLGIGYGTVEV